MNSQNLINDLLQFNGSQEYYPYYSLLLTDGAYFLAEKAQCFWLMDVIWTHSVSKQWYGKESFVTCTLTVENHQGKVTFHDGNDNFISSQNIPYTDFPLERTQLFLVSDGSQFVVMLPGEY